MFCFHKWKILGKYEFIDTSFGEELPKTTYHLQCEKCGKLKGQDLDMCVKESKQ